MRVPVGFHRSEKFGILIGEPIPLGRRLFASSEEYEEVISKVKRAYGIFVEEINRIGLKEALDKFLREVSRYAFLDSSFISCLAEELSLSEKEIMEAIVSTSYFSEKLDFLKRNFRKIRKENSVEYAEGFGEIVSFLGLKGALDLLKRNGLRMGKSTLQALYNVSLMPTWFKRRIGVDIPLTIAFEIPNFVDEDLVERIAGLRYQDAKKVLKELKSNYKKDVSIS